MTGVYIVAFFLSVYIKKYNNRVRGKEKSNVKVSTFTLLALSQIHSRKKTNNVFLGSLMKG